MWIQVWLCSFNLYSFRHIILAKPQCPHLQSDDNNIAHLYRAVLRIKCDGVPNSNCTHSREASHNLPSHLKRVVWLCWGLVQNMNLDLLKSSFRTLTFQKKSFSTPTTMQWPRTLEQRYYFITFSVSW